MPDRLTTQLLRLYCDGELAPAERAEVERRLAASPHDRAALEAEMKLRRSVASAMEQSAPAALRAQVEAALRREIESGGLDPRRHPTAGPVRVPRRKFASALASWAAGPQRVNVFAVAACLLLVAGAVLVGIFGQPIDKARAISPRALTIRAVQYVTLEHEDCLGDERRFAAKIARGKTPEAAQRLISDHLRVEIEIPDLAPLGYSFVGGGPCGVPGSLYSAHLIYSKSKNRADGSPVFISVFMEPNTGQFSLPRNEHFPVAEGVGDGRMWADESLVYFVVAGEEADLPAAYAAVKDQVERSYSGRDR